MKKKKVNKKKRPLYSKNTLLLVFILIVATIFSLTVVTQRQLFNPYAQTVGTQYYVDGVSGSDSNAGTSESSPWKSLSKVMNASFSPGDTINFKRNSVWNQQFTIRSNGTSNAKITYQAYGTGAAPVVDAQANYAMTVGGSWNVVKDFKVSNGKEASIDVTGTYNQIRGNEVTNSGAGVWIHGSNNLVTQNHAYGLRMITNTPGGDDDAGAVGFVIEASNAEISYNTCTNCKAPSYDYVNDGGFVEVWMRGDNAYVHHNHAINTEGFFELGGQNSGTANNIRIEYNLIENAGSMLCAHTQGTFSLPTANMSITNNTFVNSAGIICDMPNGLRVQNNIFYGSAFRGASNFTHNNNIYSQNPAFSLGSGEKIADPKFVNAGAGNYHLQAGSPAIDAGANVGLSIDYDGKTVPFGSSPDIGAFEYGATSGTNPTATQAVVVPTEPLISPTYECIGGVNCVPSPSPTVFVEPSSIEPTSSDPSITEPTDAPTSGVQPSTSPSPNTNPGRGGNPFMSFIQLLLALILSLLKLLMGNN